jgi:formylglycine-generating enzyme required for sulfatase activity/uncharacterized caspase-like protein
MAKIALLLGVGEYEEGLDALPSATKDIEAMQAVLINPEIGGFAETDVTVLPNPSRQQMEDAIYALFANREKDDLVLLYFSGHGVVDEANRFYFASRQTRKERGKLMPTTALAASTVQDYMHQSKSQRQVVILDSCFSGAFAKGVNAKDSGSVNLDQFLGGEGRAILTASTSTQYALTQEGFELSIYTHFLVEGLRTGGADVKGEGWITVEDVHVYTSSKVREAAPAMTPEFYPVKAGYTIQLAKSPKDDPALKYRKEVQNRAYEGRFSIPARRLLTNLRGQLKLEAGVAEAIEAEVLRPYLEYQRKVRDYEETLKETLQAEPTLKERTKQDLKAYQQQLGLRDEDVALIEKSCLGQTMSVIADVEPTVPTFTFEVVTVNAKGEKTGSRPGQSEYFAEDLGNGIVLEMVSIPSGTFQMGSPATELGRDEWEGPQHEVKVPAFWMGRYAITQEQWRAVATLPKISIDLNSDPSQFKGDKRPVETVLWAEAVEFCARLSKKGEKLFRLPSEAEWEYACRAGTKTPFHFGETITPELANYDGNYTYRKAPKGLYRKQTTEVGSFKTANAYGLCDMHGNVWEWCQDHWHDSYEGAPVKGEAWMDKNDNYYHVVRGGSWLNDPRSCRSAYRYYDTLDIRYSSVGFRVVCDSPRTL